MQAATSLLPVEIATARETQVEQPMRFLDTEAGISARLGHDVSDPIRLFGVDGLGVDLAQLKREILPSFRELPWDEYDAKRERVEFLRARNPDCEEELSEFLARYFAGLSDLGHVAHLTAALSDDDRLAFYSITPTRRRSVAGFILRKSKTGAAGWSLEQVVDDTYTQVPDDEGDYRQLERRFAPSSPEVIALPTYRALLTRIADLTDSVHGGVDALKILCHQVGGAARPEVNVSFAPEGVHQDGCDYIVSALVVERQAIDGGESIVFGPDQRTEYLRHTLGEGEGIFQSDLGSSLWHWVTPIRPREPDCQLIPAVRNTLGYDIHLI